MIFIFMGMTIYVLTAKRNMTCFCPQFMGALLSCFGLGFFFYYILYIVGERLSMWEMACYALGVILLTQLTIGGTKVVLRGYGVDDYALALAHLHTYIFI